MRQGCAEVCASLSVLIASSRRAYADTTKSGNEQDFTNTIVLPPAHLTNFTHPKRVAPTISFSRGAPREKEQH